MDTYTTADGTEVDLMFSEVEAHKKVPAYYRIDAAVGGRLVGFLKWRNHLPRKLAFQIIDVKVEEQELQHQGIATAMYLAAKETGHEIRHSTERTMSGDSWAKSTGDPVPALQLRVTGYHGGQLAWPGHSSVRKHQVIAHPVISVSETGGGILIDVQQYGRGPVATIRIGKDQAAELAEILAKVAAE
jgi:hypothetical protein